MGYLAGGRLPAGRTLLVQPILVSGLGHLGMFWHFIGALWVISTLPVLCQLRDGEGPPGLEDVASLAQGREGPCTEQQLGQMEQVGAIWRGRAGGGEKDGEGYRRPHLGICLYLSLVNMSYGECVKIRNLPLQ